MVRSEKITLNAGLVGKMIGITLLVLCLGSLPFWIGYLYLTIMITIAIISIAVIGVVIMYGYTGLVALGNAAFFGIGAYVSAMLTVRLGISPPLALLAGVALSLLVAWAISPTLKLNPLYFGVVGLAILEIFINLYCGLTGITGGASGISGIPPFSIFGLVFNSEFYYYYFTLILLGVCYWITNNLGRSGIGTAWLSIHRGGEELSETMGIDVAGQKLKAFWVSVAMTSVAGSIYGHYMRVVIPEMGGVWLTFDLLLACLIGGIHSPLGAILGTAFIIALPELLAVLKDYVRVFNTALMVIVLIWFPGGLVQLIKLAYTHFKVLLVRLRGGLETT